jgi:hypothetical protein
VEEARWIFTSTKQENKEIKISHIVKSWFENKMARTMDGNDGYDVF